MTPCLPALLMVTVMSVIAISLILLFLFTVLARRFSGIFLVEPCDEGPAWADVCGVIITVPDGPNRDYPGGSPMAQETVPTFGSRLQRDNVYELMNPGEKLPTQMQGTNATGVGLSTNGKLGADMIRVEAGEAFPMHTHPGDHLLYVVQGKGTVTIDGVVHHTKPGDIYMVPGLVEHSVGAVEEHFLLSIGSPHKRLDDHDRMEIVDEARQEAADAP